MVDFVFFAQQIGFQQAIHLRSDTAGIGVAGKVGDFAQRSGGLFLVQEFYRKPLLLLHTSFPGLRHWRGKISLQWCQYWQSCLLRHQTPPLDRKQFPCAWDCETMRLILNIAFVLSEK